MTRDELIALYDQRMRAGFALPGNGDPASGLDGVYLDDGRFITRGPGGDYLLGQLDGSGKITTGDTFNADGSVSPYRFEGQGLDATVPLLIAAAAAGGMGLESLGMLGPSASGALPAAGTAAPAAAGAAPAAASAGSALPMAGTAAAGAAAAGAPALGGDASGFLGEGARSGVTQWDGAAALAGVPMAGIAATDPGVLSRVATQLGLPSLSAASEFLRNNPWVIPALGAGAAIAGNSDITSSQNSASSMAGNTAATGSATGSTSTAQSQGLAPWLQGYAQDFVGRAQQLAGAPSSNPTMDASRGLLTDYATQGDPLVNAARAQQQSVIAGGMLGANPYLDNVARGIGERMGDAYAVGTRANTATRFNNDGNSVDAKSAYGQTQFMNDRAFGDSLGQTMNNLYFGNYQQERGAQEAAARGSLGFGQFGVNNAQGLYNAGAQDWQRPYFQNAQFGQAINPAFGSQSTGNTNTAQNDWRNVLSNQNTQGTQQSVMQAPNNVLAGAGGALSGMALYNMMFPQRRP